MSDPNSGEDRAGAHGGADRGANGTVAKGTGAAGAGDAGADGRVAVDRAAHVTDAYDVLIQRCRAEVAGGRHGLVHVAHYSAGVYDFAVDLMAGPDGPDARTRRRRIDIGRRLNFKMTGLDHALEEVRSGQLVRTVLHTECGVVHCHLVKPGAHLVALMEGRGVHEGRSLTTVPEVRRSDQGASALATALRRELSLGSFAPGGWEHESRDWLTARPGEGSAPVTPPATASGAAPFRQGDGDAATIDRCAAAMDPNELAYVAHYQDGGTGFSLDLFDHPAVARFFTHISVAARRNFYARFGREFAILGRQLAQMVRPLLAGRLLRVVLDVEQGAIYYYRLGSGAYLIGVTLSQHTVSQGDDRIAELARELRALRTR